MISAAPKRTSTNASPVVGITGWLTIGALAVDQEARHHRRQQTTPPHPPVVSATSRSRVAGHAVWRPIGHTALSDSGAQQRRRIGQATLGQAALTRPAAGPQLAHKGGGSRQEEKRNEGEKRRSTSDARRRSTALTSVARGRGARPRRR